MTIVSVFTKQHIADIKESDDEFDKIYQTRLAGVKTVQQLSDFIRDYEEFLPEGLQKFRDAPEAARRELLFQKDRFLEVARRGQMLAEPTEAACLFAPPVVSMPRTMAMTLMAEEKAKGRNVKITWGMAFLKLANEGMLQKLIRTQENMYKRVIDIKKYVQEALDTEWTPSDE
jgi:hypothetical protein